MFDHLLEPLAGRHGLAPDQARALLAAWLDRIFDPARGGPAGFLAAFRAQGLEDLAGSWVAPGPNRPLTADQLERVFGERELADLAARLDLPAAVVASASAALLPEAVDSLGEDGRWPGPAEWPPAADPAAAEPAGLQAVRDAGLGPLSASDAPLYRAHDDAPHRDPADGHRVDEPVPAPASASSRARRWAIVVVALLAMVLAALLSLRG
ncbi:YidB family protein [Lysobacter silvisoli]|uniref:DUF937 domain-containing protein n=1 Tax=Lysobacter silvisoli TaxID=2293254 RepID=A0A371K4Y0_9GAMM|nr:YidB family protein [Lysobacter silvisoli]RDZ28965.1 hypothetical protein DX914_07650 [Lysobacter silvisoli]